MPQLPKKLEYRYMYTVDKSSSIQQELTVYYIKMRETLHHIDMAKVVLSVHIERVNDVVSSH